MSRESQQAHIETIVELLTQIGDQFRSGFFPRVGHSEEWDRLQRMRLTVEDLSEIRERIETQITEHTSRLQSATQEDLLDELREAIPTFCRMYSATHTLQLLYIETRRWQTRDSEPCTTGEPREIIRRCIVASHMSVDLLGSMGFTLPMIREKLIMANRIGVDPASEWCANRLSPPASLATTQALPHRKPQEN